MSKTKPGELRVYPRTQLLDAEKTQSRMNRILDKKLDPNLSVRYRTYKLDGKRIGLVAVEGTNTPYVVAIEDQVYGGPRNRGAPSYIYRGVTYVRQGANTLIANRQSQILSLVSTERPNVMSAMVDVLVISATIGAGVGAGVMIWDFATPHDGGFVGLIWGAVIGGGLGRRLSGTVGSLMRNAFVKRASGAIFGLLFGAGAGFYMGYAMVDYVHTRPFAMSLMGPLVGALVSVILIGPAIALLLGAVLNYMGMAIDMLENKMRS